MRKSRKPEHKAKSVSLVPCAPRRGRGRARTDARIDTEIELDQALLLPPWTRAAILAAV